IQDIEASSINGDPRPTPAQIRTEVWMAVVHGADGIQYFCHRFAPTFSETDCLDDAPTAAALTEINAQLVTLAPVLNTPPIGTGVAVAVASDTGVDTLLKRQAGSTWLFAVEMHGKPTRPTFTLRGLDQATAEVLGEARTLTVTAGAFTDDFDAY